MADHVRTQLRNAAATRVTGLTTTSTRVHPFRVDPLQLTELPALSVWTPNEQATVQTIHAPITYEREVEIRISAVMAAVGVGNVDDALDGICKEVEAALGTALSVGSPAKSVLLQYRGVELDYERGEKTVGVAEMSFTGKIYSAGNAPDVLL